MSETIVNTIDALDALATLRQQMADQRAAQTRLAALLDRAQALVAKLERQPLATPSPDDGDDLRTLQGKLTDEIENALAALALGDGETAGLLSDDIQPPTTITRLAAEAAAAVYMAFERGYRMDAEVR